MIMYTLCVIYDCERTVYIHLCDRSTDMSLSGALIEIKKYYRERERLAEMSERLVEPCRGLLVLIQQKAIKLVRFKRAQGCRDGGG